MTDENAGLFLKIPGQLGKWPNSPVSVSPHIQLRNTHSVCSGSSTGLCHPTLLFFFWGPSPQIEMSAACHPLSLRRKRYHSWIFYSGLKQSQNLGLGQKRIKTLFTTFSPKGSGVASQRRDRKEVRAKMQNWQNTGGMAQENMQLQKLNIPRAALIFINKEFSRVW